MTPMQYRKGGSEVVIHYASGKTSLGVTMIAATERGICFLQFGENKKELLVVLKAEFPNATIQSMPESGAAQFEEWMKALNRYLDQKQTLKKLPLDIRGTAFQMLVWRYLQTIPAGDVRSYKEVAEAIGRPKAIRAVATACASNSVALAIPCHRVVRGDGALAGYRWGIERKRTLIDHERRTRR
jgi:AraC family transcriptional regulator of adaptative response/methylated-DNA-[protein]-cysteine methyltransferase